ncbi:MAG: hypothetical protein FWD32_01825 [Firmicutes bacterium]|nr:hypothetical protein [Bacillota bacterium]
MTKREDITKLITRVQHDNSAATSTGFIESDFEDFDVNRYYYEKASLNKVDLNEEDWQGIGKDKLALMHFARSVADEYALLGTFSEFGSYILSTEIINDLVAMYKCKSRFRTINLLPDEMRKTTQYESVLSYRERGRFIFTVGIVNFYSGNVIIQKRATLRVLEKIENVCGMVNNTLSTEIAVYNEIDDLENFESNMRSKFNIIDDSEYNEDTEEWFKFGTAIYDKKYNYPALSALLGYQSQMKGFMANGIEKSEKEYFDKRKKILAKSGKAGQEILDALEEIQKKGSRFLHKDSGEYYKASNEVLDMLIENLMVNDNLLGGQIKKDEKKAKEERNKRHKDVVDRARLNIAKRGVDIENVEKFKGVQEMAFLKFGKGLNELTDDEVEQLINDLKKKDNKDEHLRFLNRSSAVVSRVPILKIDGKKEVTGRSVVDEIKDYLAKKRAAEKGVKVTKDGTFEHVPENKDLSLEEKQARLQDLVAKDKKIDDYKKVVDPQDVKRQAADSKKKPNAKEQTAQALDTNNVKRDEPQVLEKRPEVGKSDRDADKAVDGGANTKVVGDGSRIGQHMGGDGRTQINPDQINKEKPPIVNTLKSGLLSRSELNCTGKFVAENSKVVAENKSTTTAGTTSKSITEAFVAANVKE